MTDIDFDKKFNIFKQNISLDGDEKTELNNAKNKIRQKLRESFTSPKFLTQGSFAYKTINFPCQPPIQQMDLDDGMYLFEPLEEGEKPSKDPEQLLIEVENCLKPLCEENQWELLEQNKKNTCVRIILEEYCHIDIPVYIISDIKMQMLEKNLAEQILSFRNSLLDDYDIGDVWLAQRDGSWLASDPRVTNLWVEDAVKRHSNYYYREIVRFFKAWRDYNFKKSELSSICLMVMIDKEMQRINISDNSKISIVHAISKQLRDTLNVGYSVDSPFSDSDLSEGISQNHRKELCSKLGDLTDNCQDADSQNNTKYLRKSFGKRFPLCPKEQDEDKSNDKNVQVVRRSPTSA